MTARRVAWLELATVGIVVAVAWLAAAWVAGAGETWTWQGWVACGAAIAVTWGVGVEGAVRVAARAERDRRRE